MFTLKLAALLRPGNAGSGTAADHIRVLGAALAQLPVDPHTQEVIVRTDSAALSHEFLEGCRERGCRFVVGHALTAEVASAVVKAPPSRWIPAVSADGTEEREGAEVAEVSDLVDLSAWPEGTVVDGTARVSRFAGWVRYLISRSRNATTCDSHSAG